MSTVTTDAAAVTLAQVNAEKEGYSYLQLLFIFSAVGTIITTVALYFVRRRAQKSTNDLDNYRLLDSRV